MQLTLAQLMMCTGCTLLRAQNWLTSINAALAAYEINTPHRVCAFLAQVAQESGRLVYVREMWGPNQVVAQRTYERDRTQPWGPQLVRGDRNFKAFTLGNSEVGDGFRFRGRGLIQTTGRSNYRQTRDRLRQRISTPVVPNFEAFPEMLEAPRWAAMSAADFWDSRDLNALADMLGRDTTTDRKVFEMITRKINGGLTHLDERLSFWAQGKRAFDLA